MEDFLKSLDKLPLKVIDKNIPIEAYKEISISSNNEELKTFDVSSSQSWEDYITVFLQKRKAEVAFGGYLEVRDIYKRSTYFNASNSEERNIHLGIDLWCKKETKVLAVLDGVIHSFKNNKNHGDYGPTIILKHELKGNVFYSLYGHLSIASIENIIVGQKIEREEVIGFLGDNSVNGDYSPHLHFQLIVDIKDNKGDYPGVSTKSNLKFYKKNCPNPNLLLKLPYEI